MTFYDIAFTLKVLLNYPQEQDTLEDGYELALVYLQSEKAHVSVYGCMQGLQTIDQKIKHSMDISDDDPTELSVLFLNTVVKAIQSQKSQADTSTDQIKKAQQLVHQKSDAIQTEKKLIVRQMGYMRHVIQGTVMTSGVMLSTQYLRTRIAHPLLYGFFSGALFMAGMYRIIHFRVLSSMDYRLNKLGNVSGQLYALQEQSCLFGNTLRDFIIDCQSQSPESIDIQPIQNKAKEIADDVKDRILKENPFALLD